MGWAKGRSASLSLRSLLVGMLLFGAFQFLAQVRISSQFLQGDKKEIEAFHGNTRPSSSSREDLLSLYNPFSHPVYPEASSPPPSSPLKVGIISTTPLSGETLHFLYDGVVRSSKMELVGVVSLFDKSNETASAPSQALDLPYFSQERDPSEVDLWIVDGHRVAKLKRQFLDNLLQSQSPSWKVLIIDYSDRVQFQLPHYQRLGIWDKPHIRVAFRSIVQGRFFDGKQNAIHPGYIAPNLPTAGGSMIHCPYAARSDIIEALQVELKRVGVSSSSEQTNRPVDVYHPWQVVAKKGKSKYRNAVSKVVRSWNGTTLDSRRREIVITSIEEQGPRRAVGRNAANREYVRALLSAKIVVVTQKDNWIDHYRLMEALVSGSMVLADEILAPPTGLKDGKNVVFFSNLTHMEELARYYLSHSDERLAIAESGERIAMSQHRSWHRMESLVFGKIMTP